MTHGAVLSSCRIVCEMGEAKPSQHAGFVEICVAVCRPEFMARSSQLYYFMVSPDHQRPGWASAGLQPLYHDCWTSVGKPRPRSWESRPAAPESWGDVASHPDPEGLGSREVALALGPHCPLLAECQADLVVRVWTMHENSWDLNPGSATW